MSLMRDAGFYCGKDTKTEYRGYNGASHDLLQIIDMLAFYPGKIVGVQATSRENHAARRNKMLGSKGAEIFLGSHGILLLISWKNYAKKINRRGWRPSIERIMLDRTEVLVEGENTDFRGDGLCQMLQTYRG